MKAHSERDGGLAILALTTWLILTSRCGAQREPMETSSRGSARDALADVPNGNIWANLNVDSPLRNQTKYVGEKVSFDCEITGYPTPRYTWYKGEQEIQVALSKRYRILGQDWGSRLRIDKAVVNDVGAYRCSGTNLKGTVETTAYLTLQQRAAVQTVSATSPSSSRSSTAPIDQILLPSISDDDIRPFGASIQQPASDEDEVNPYCQPYKGTYCAFLKDQNIYVTSRKSQHLADMRIMRMLNDLNALALHNKQCFTRAREAMCYHQMPPCAEDNYQRAYQKKMCRNECEDLVTVCSGEFGSNERAWRLLPNCAELSNGVGCIRMDQTEQPSLTEAAAKDKETRGDDIPYTIIVPTAAGAILVIVVVVTVCLCRRRVRSKRSGAKPVDGSEHGSEVKEHNGKVHEMSIVSSHNGCPEGDKGGVAYMKDVSVGNIHFQQELGEGQFGKVFRSLAFGLYGNGTSTTVLVKTLRERATSAVALAFRREIDDMVELRHQHVALLLGVSLQGSPLCALYEYLPLGDLRQFLLAHAPDSGCDVDNVDSGTGSLSARELTYVATQTASALEYLNGAGRVHGDVATRNVLIGHNLSVKLSILSLSYGLYSSDYCPLHGGRPTPVRWQPPEAITYGQCSREADVYAFGVLLWELFSFGRQPYAGCSNQEVMEMVRSRQLLACPPTAPPRLYSLMMECWHESPAKRPTARELHQKLRAWYLDDGAPSAVAFVANGIAGRTITSKSLSSSAASSSSGAASHLSRDGGGFGGSGGGGVRSLSSGTNVTDMRGSGSGEGSALLPPSLPSPPYVLAAPSYYSQALPYVSVAKMAAVPAGRGSENDNDSSSEPSEKAQATGSSGASYNSLSRKYVETQVDFPQNYARFENDQV